MQSQQISWMWADANVVGNGFGAALAHANPLRWSTATDVPATIADLESHLATSEMRSVILKVRDATGRSKVEHCCSDVAAAISILRGQPGACATVGCMRSAAEGYPTCCRTCIGTSGATHGPTCASTPAQTVVHVLGEAPSAGASCLRPEQPVEEWTPIQVKQWASAVGFPAVAALMEEHKVHGQSLLTFTVAQLQADPFKMKAGPALKLRKELDACALAGRKEPCQVDPDAQRASHSAVQRLSGGSPALVAVMLEEQGTEEFKTALLELQRKGCPRSAVDELKVEHSRKFTQQIQAIGLSEGAIEKQVTRFELLLEGNAAMSVSARGA